MLKKTMRRLPVLVLLFALALHFTGVSAIPTTAANGYNVKIMTFNVRNMRADDGTPNSWDNRKDKAVAVINNFSPDVIGLQEADIAQINYFKDNCNGTYTNIGDSRRGNTTDEYSSIMYRSDKFNLLLWGEFWLSETPDVAGSYSSYDSSYPRMCTWVKLQAKDNANAVFYYFNTHLSLVEAAQQQGIDIILDRIEEYVSDPNAAVFIGGDLNFDQTSPLYSYLQNTAFSDTWSQAGKSFTNAGTFHGFTGDRNRGHIDWIFQKNALSINSIDIDYYNVNNLYPSDHYPVNLSVTIPLTNDTEGRPIGKTIWLKSNANNKYVTARKTTTNSPLGAIASSVESWELYDVIDAGDGFIALRSKANNNYVLARVSTTYAPLQAISGSIASWEKFIWVKNSDGTISLKSHANNKFVMARISDTTNAPLEARSDEIRGWEKFTWGQ